MRYKQSEDIYQRTRLYTNVQIYLSTSYVNFLSSVLTIPISAMKDLFINRPMVCSMGTPVSPIISNLYMKKKKTEHLHPTMVYSTL